jgi:hypothetical protein
VIVAHRHLDGLRVELERSDAPALDGARHPAALLGADQHERVRRQVLQPLCDGHRAVVQLLDEHAVAEVLGGEPVGCHAPEVEVALEQLADAADQHGHQSGVSPRRTSRC